MSTRSALSIGFPITVGLLACTTGKVSDDSRQADSERVETFPPASVVGPAAAKHPAPTDKLDLLFVVDNSASMGDKQALLRRAIPDLIGRLVRPRCLDAAGRTTGRATPAGTCDQGAPEFLPLRDLHVGFISSSLGARGGDQCGSDPGRFNDDRAHLLDRVKEASAPVPEAGPHHFLAWLPDVSENQGKPRDPATVGATPFANADDFTGAAGRVLDGVGESGCGYEAPMEAAYRFLVQPDPYERIVRDGDSSRLEGYDFTLLAQRKAFLRPDSAVAIVLVTDENESNVAPTAFGGRSWRFTDSRPVRPGTSICGAQPASPACQSCYLTFAAGDPGCGTVLNEDSDHPNLRFFDMKRRFGVDPTYPVARYANGFEDLRVPSRDKEYMGDVYVGSERRVCTNPLFAASLPSGVGEELCDLPPGPRTAGNVYLAVLGGVPWQLLTEQPDDLSRDNTAAYKATLDEADWVRLVGSDPAGYDYKGQHPLMRESIFPRQGAGEGGAHAREWNTANRDLQYACTFDLETPIDCSSALNRDTCDCSEPSDSPACHPAKPTLQIRAKAYPSIRPIMLARALGRSGVVGSICPRESKDGTSPLFGYRPIFDALVDRMAASLVKP